MFSIRSPIRYVLDIGEFALCADQWLNDLTKQNTRTPFTIAGSQFALISQYEDARALLSGPDGIAKLHNSFLKDTVGNKTVITAYHDPDHRVLRRATARGLFPLQESELDTIRGITRSHVGVWTKNGEIDVQTAAHNLALDIALTVFLGASFTPNEREELGAVLHKLQVNVPAGAVILSRVWAKGLIPRISQSIPGFFPGPTYRRIIQDVVHQEEKRGSLRSPRFHSLVHSFTKSMKNIGEVQLSDQFAAVLLAAHETLTCSLGWMITLLGIDQKDQALLREQRNFGNETYLRWWIMEMLRLYPPLWLMLRTTSESSGREVVCIINAEALNQDFRWGSDANKFSAQRYSVTFPESITFGFGRRRCLGEHIATAELLTILEEILSRCDLSLHSSVAVERSNLMRPAPAAKLQVRKIH